MTGYINDPVAVSIGRIGVWARHILEYPYGMYISGSWLGCALGAVAE